MYPAIHFQKFLTPTLPVKLDRAPGAREQRWAHLLSGPVDASALVLAKLPSGNSLADAAQRISALETELVKLQATVKKVGKS
jgi:uncharacterized protein YceH (UPF0502 family)